MEILSFRGAFLSPVRAATMEPRNSQFQAARSYDDTLHKGPRLLARLYAAQREVDMKWDMLLAVLSILLLMLFTGAGLVEYAMEAEAVAEDLAPQIGVDKDILRSHLEEILRNGSVRRTVVQCSPLALLSLLLLMRLFLDVARKQQPNGRLKQTNPEADSGTVPSTTIF